MACEMVSQDTALKLATKALIDNRVKYLPASLEALYTTRHIFLDGSKRGWVISAKLDVPESFEPNMIFVEVSDPSGLVNIPALL